MKRQQIESLASALQTEYGFGTDTCRTLAMRLNKEGFSEISEDLRAKIILLEKVLGHEHLSNLSQYELKRFGTIGLSDILKLPTEDLEMKTALWLALYETTPCTWRGEWLLSYEELREKAVWWVETRGTEEPQWPHAFTDTPLSELKVRYEQIVSAIGAENFEGRNLYMPAEEIIGYRQICDEIGLTYKEMMQVMKTVLGCGNRILRPRSSRHAKCVVDGLSRFEITEETRRAFVCEAAGCIFDRPTEDAEWFGEEQILWIYDTLCETYGPEEGFRRLREKPWVMQSYYHELNW